MAVQDRQTKQALSAEARAEFGPLFDISLETLDRDWLQQAKAVFNTGLLQADARDVMDRAKASLDVAIADAKLEIARNPEEFDLEKTTVDAIAAAAAKHDLVKIARERYNRHKHRVDVIQAALNALEHQKRALQHLVELHKQGYFAAPTTDAEGYEVLDRQREGHTKGHRRPLREGRGG
jgi:hypothetical protein